MNLIDMHCDTIYEMLSGETPKDLRKNNLKVDLEKLRKAGSAALSVWMNFWESPGTSRHMNMFVSWRPA